MTQKIVIALGGNALLAEGQPATAEAQLEMVKKTCIHIAEIAARYGQIGIVHGNGPQVGRIFLASQEARYVTPAMPLDVCGAMSQGYIGYQLQQALRAALQTRGVQTPVAGLLTQVVVDRGDPAFLYPVKPIGPFYGEAEAKALAERNGYTVCEDAGRGWRRVVASPMPQRIVEIDTIRKLWESSIVIACGGGGIPVFENADGSLEGTAAVIDKDFSAALLAEQLQADVLLILTGVEKIAIRYGRPDQQDISHMTVQQAEGYAAEGHFSAGSMLPKVQAALRFVKNASGRCAIITSLDKATEALEGKTGTVIGE